MTRTCRQTTLEGMRDSVGGSLCQMPPPQSLLTSRMPFIMQISQ